MRSLAFAFLTCSMLWAEPLTLQQVQQLALQHSPQLREGESKVREARYRVDEAYTQVAPTLQLNAGANRTTPSVAAQFGGRSVDIIPEYNYNAQLSLRQTLLTFGRLRWSAATAELQEKSQQADLQERRLRMLEESALLYYETLQVQEQVRIAEDLVKAREAHLKDARHLVKAGSAAVFDVKRDEAALAQAEQQLLEARNRVGLARVRLFTLIQQPDQGQTLEEAESPPAPPRCEVELALQRRNDLQAVRWAAEAARARIYLQEAANNPNLGFQTDYTLRNQTGLSPAYQWVVGLNLQIPLYDGGLSQARAQQAREVVEQLEAQLEQAQRQAQIELQSLALDLDNRYQRIEVARRSLDSAQESARIARLRYQNGLSTNVELLDAEANLTQARQDWIVSRYQYWQNLARWKRAFVQEELTP